MEESDCDVCVSKRGGDEETGSRMETITDPEEKFATRARRGVSRKSRVSRN